VAEGRAVRVCFGDGSLDLVGAEATALGGRVLLISGGHEVAAADRVSAQLGDACVGRLRDVREHVPVETARAAVTLAVELAAHSVVAIGGGSATGLAKAIALETGLPILAVPTTYAGSEMTPIWGRTDQQGKTTGRDLRVLPRTVVYDPSLTTSLPPGNTAASGMNAMAHALESLYAPDTSPALTTVAEEALRAVATGLPVAVAEPLDLPARTTTLYGAWLAGWSLGATTMGLHHKLAHALGGSYRLPHASTHSALLPQVAAFNAPFAEPAFAVASRALGVRSGAEVAAALYDVAERVGAPVSLAELGLDEGAIESVVQRLGDADITNPRPVTAADLRDILRSAFHGTRPAAPT
jgi:maleylacetate reductase